MNKRFIQAVGLFFLGSLVVQEASAGTANMSTILDIQFNQATNITQNGEFSFMANVSATVNLDMSANVQPYSFQTVITGTGFGDGMGDFGTFSVPLMPVDMGACGSGFTCNVMMSGIDIFANTNPFGHTFTATGTLCIGSGNCTTDPVVDVKSASFVAAAVPEPALLALMATGLFGIAVTRRRTAR